MTAGRGDLRQPGDFSKSHLSGERETYKSHKQRNHPLFPLGKKYRIPPIIIDIYYYIGILLSSGTLVRPIYNFRSNVRLVNYQLPMGCLLWGVVLSFDVSLGRLGHGH